MKEALKVTLLVFSLQLTLLIGITALFAHFGGNIVHEINGQDAREYMLLADQILIDGSYHVPGFAVPESWRPPGYPLLVAAIFFLFNHSLAVLLVALALVGGVISALTYLIGREVGLSYRWSFAAGLLIGVSPALIWIPPSGMGGDTTFLLLFLGAWYLTLRIERSSWSVLLAVAIGLLLGGATLIRPLGIYFALFAIINLYLSIQTFSKKRILTLLFLCIASFAIVITPWMWRNEVHAGHFGISSQFAFNPYYYNIAGYNAWRQGTALEKEQGALIAELGAPDIYSVINGFTYYDHLKEYEWKFLQENFFSYSMFHLFRTLPFFFGSGVNVIYATITNEIPNLHAPFFPTSSQNTASLFYAGSYTEVVRNLLYYWPATLERLVWLTLFILAFTAPFVTSGRQRQFAIMSVLFILAVALLASPIAQPRYRIPAEPFIWLSAALALSALRPTLRSLFGQKKDIVV